MKPTEQNTDLQKRQRIIKSLAVGGVAITAWHKPIINSVILPAHAQTSDVTSSASPNTSEDGGVDSVATDNGGVADINQHQGPTGVTPFPDDDHLEARFRVHRVSTSWGPMLVSVWGYKGGIAFTTTNDGASITGTFVAAGVPAGTDLTTWYIAAAVNMNVPHHTRTPSDCYHRTTHSQASSAGTFTVTGIATPASVQLLVYESATGADSSMRAPSCRA